MTLNKPQCCSVRSRNRVCALFLFCAGASQLIAGCAARKNAPQTWRGAGVVHPRMPATVAPHPRPLSDESVDPVPELRWELPPPPPPLSVRAAPARPHIAPPPVPENNVASKPEPPLIAPQLTPEQTNAARQQMSASLSVAEKNLARSQGRTLNATQSDLAAKIKEFIGDARSAGRDGDWTRARSLATKAQVLSEELAASL